MEALQAASQQFIMGNALSLMGAILLVVQMTRSDMQGAFRVRCVSMGIMTLAFAIMGCWSASVTSAFSLAISAYESFSRGPRNSMRIVLSTLSAVFAAATQSWAGGLDFVTALPVISALLTSFGFCFSGSVGMMRAIAGLDSALWLAHDSSKMMFACVFCDFLGLGMALAHLCVNRLDPEDGYWDALRFAGVKGKGLKG